MCLVRITNAILSDENTIITVSRYDKDNDIYIGMPSVINREGIKENIEVKLNEEEAQKLQNSIAVIKKATDSIL